MAHVFKAGEWAMVQVVEVAPDKLRLQHSGGPYVTISAANIHPIPSPPDPARAAAERAVVETAMGWADGRNGGTALTKATTALRALDTPPGPQAVIAELILASSSWVAWTRLFFRAGGQHAGAEKRDALRNTLTAAEERYDAAVKAARKVPG